MLQFEHHIIYIAAAMIISLLLALFIYHKDIRFASAKRSTRVALILLRFISISSLALLLFKPKQILEFNKVEKPIIVVLQDASSSIVNYSDSNYYKKELQELIATNNQDLISEYNVHSYYFSDTLFKADSLNFNGNKTNISLALDNINERYHNRNLAAIILASDGNYNRGINPIYQTKSLNTPIYCLALGTDSVFPDLSVQNIQFNEIAYLGNEFPLNFELFSNSNSTGKSKLEIFNQDKLVYEEWVQLKANAPLEKQLYLEAKHEGIQHFDVRITSFDDEKNINNNSQKIAVEILDNTHKVLILSASPHPDIAALQSALSEGENYVITSSNAKDYNGNINEYNLIILHQLPQTLYHKLIEEVVESDISTLFIGGTQTNWNAFNKEQNIAKVHYKNSLQEIFPNIEESFTPFNLSNECKSFLQQTPPLIAPFGEIENINIDHNLFTQNIEGINTNNPLLSFGTYKDKQIAILFAEGLWRWKLYDYKKHQSHENFNELIQSVSQYLTLNKDKRKLRLHYQKVIDEGQNFLVNAQLYNDNYQLVDDADLSLKLIDINKTENHYSFKNYGDKYQLSIDFLEPGNYRLEVLSKNKGQEITITGELSVTKTSIEQQDYRANWGLLKQLSNLSGGQFISKSNFENYSNVIKQNIPSTSKTHFHKKLSDIINQKLIFLLILLSLCIEWAIRKNLGTH